jgi:adenylylsulfate kinase-like enzyme
MRGYQQVGPIIWFTGPSGAGKSTLANATHAALSGRWPVELLDDNEVRLWLTDESTEDRNIDRIAHVACLLARNGVAVAVAAVSPLAAARAQARMLAKGLSIPFIEVSVTASPEVLMTRRRKTQTSGIVSTAYEMPVNSELAIDTSVEPPKDSMSHVLALLDAHGILCFDLSFLLTHFD